MDMDQIRRDCDDLCKMEPLDAMQRVFETMKTGGGPSLAILALDKGIAEVTRLRNALTFVDQQGAEAIERISSGIVADKWNATAAFQARALKAEAERDALHDRIEGALAAALGNPVMSIHDGDGPVADSLESLIALVASEHASVRRIRAEHEDLRLTLLVEQGDQKGAPAGWERNGDHWVKHFDDGHVTVRKLDEGYGYRYYIWRTGVHIVDSMGDRPTARATMIAADDRVFGVPLLRTCGLSEEEEIVEAKRSRRHLPMVVHLDVSKLEGMVRAKIRRVLAEFEQDGAGLVQDSPWFVVHQRDGRPRVEIFSGEGAEHAAKIRARDHATNWSEIYIMQGVEVHGGDFEDEAMVERANGSQERT